MKCKRLKPKENWHHYEQDWIRLENLLVSCPFRSWQMFEASSDFWTELYVFEVSGQVVGLIPVASRYGVLATTIGYRDFNYACFVADPTFSGQILDCLSKNLHKCMIWKGLRDWDNFDSEWRYHLEHTYRNYFTTELPTYLISFHKIEDAYLLHKAKKHSVKKREKRLKQLGELTYEELVIQDLPELLALHTKRWKQRRDTSGTTDQKKQQWLTALWKTNLVKVFGLKLNGKVIAFQWDFCKDNQVVSYWTGFDSGYAAYAPGFVLLKNSLEQCKQSGYTKFDFSIGYESYKAYWATDQSSCYLTIVSTKRMYFVAQLVKRYFWMKQKLKQSPKLVQFVRTKGRSVIHGE